MKKVLKPFSFCLAVLLIFPFFTVLLAEVPAFADTSQVPSLPRRYAADNHTFSYSLPSVPGLTDSAKNFNASAAPPAERQWPAAAAVDGIESQGAGSLDDVYVNDRTGDNSYDGSSPTLQPGGVGPKKTIQAGIDVCGYYGIVHIAAGTYREHITVDSGMWLQGAGSRDTFIDGGNSGMVVDILAYDHYILMSGLAICNGNGYWAGGIANGLICELELWQCAVVNNYGEVAGGIYNEVGILYLDQCLVAGNVAGECGGGILNDIANVWISDSTISGNSLAPGGGYGGGIFSCDALIYLISSTVANNSAAADSGSAGGGIADFGSDWLFLSTVISGNHASLAGSGNAYYYGTPGIIDDSNCIDSENSCHFTDSTSQINTDPGLGPLRNNGGSTDTHAISVDSPAFDSGYLFSAADQRDVARPQGLAADVGAYEVELNGSANINARGGTGPEVICFTSSSGGIVGLTALSPSYCSASLPPGMILPYGLFSFRVVSIAPGSTVRIIIKFPRVIPATFRYYKCSGDGTLVDITSLVTHNPGDDFIVLTLTDGGPGDLDGLVNGRFTDPGGPSWVINAVPQSSSAYIAPPQQPAALPSISVQSACLAKTEVQRNEAVNLTVNMSNTGDASGTIKLLVTVNGDMEAVKGVSVNSGSMVPVTLPIGRGQPGIYSVYAGGVYAGDFTVKDDAASRAILIISSAMLGMALALGCLLILRRRRTD